VIRPTGATPLLHPKSRGCFQVPQSHLHRRGLRFKVGGCLVKVGRTLAEVVLGCALA